MSNAIPQRTWRGKPIDTIGELLNAAASCITKKDADGLMVTYREYEPDYADQNMGYILGYLGPESRQRLYGLFRLAHPIFGDMTKAEPSAKEAFVLGGKIQPA